MTIPLCRRLARLHRRLEIVVMLETEFGIKVKNESAARDNFHSISSLATS